MDLVIIAKIESIERCLKRIADKYVESTFEEDFDMQDIVILNLQRACEQSIDIAHRILKIKQLGIAKDSAETFMLLAEHTIIEKQLAGNLKKMVGFRNLAVHDYANMDMKVVKLVVEYGIKDLKKFIGVALAFDVI